MIDPKDIPDSQIVLYADDGYDSHVVRLLLAEKKVKYYLSLLDSERPEDLRQLILTIPFPFWYIATLAYMS